MDLLVNLMSVAVLLFGNNKLPPKFSYMRRGECPSVEPQDPFLLSQIEGVTYYLNHATGQGNVSQKYRCITLRVEERQEDYFLHIYAMRRKPGEPDEQSWHTLRPEVALGRFEIDMRLMNQTDHQAHAYLYYNQKPFGKTLFLYTCVHFPQRNKHAVSGVIASSKPALLPRQINMLNNQIDRITDVKLPRPGFTLRNNCTVIRKPHKSGKTKKDGKHSQHRPRN